MRLNQNEFEEFNPKDFLNFASELNFKIFEFDSSRSSLKEQFLIGLIMQHSSV